MSFGYFQDRGFVDELRSALEKIHNLSNNALVVSVLHGVEHVETDGEQEIGLLHAYVRQLAMHTANLTTLLQRTQSSTALVRTEHSVSAEYRLAEDRNSCALSETALVVARPSLLQLVTDSVPAIDLDDRHHLLHSFVEIMNKNNQAVPNSSSTALQTKRPSSMPSVTIVEQPIISDVSTLKYLFEPKKLVNRKPSAQVDFS